MINKAKKKAAALKYDEQSQKAPYIVALGEGHVAERMIDTARESGVEVVEDKGLSNLLHKISIGDEIPQELYEVVAKILVFVNAIDEDFGKRNN